MVSPEFLSLQEALAGRFSLERELGRGGMGIVILARDVALDRLVAIKLLPPPLVSVPERRARFLREARTAAGLSHPNIVPIHLVEERGDLVFFVMGFVDGETLRQRVAREGPLSPKATMRMVQEVAWALSYAHQRGIVHRDVKPDNIMLEREGGRAVVTDFGIAWVGGEDDEARGELVGTARYMSPEQAAGETVDARSDLYSLGATAFFALTGRPPFDAPTVPALLAKHVAVPAPSVTSVRKEIPEKLAVVVAQCLEKSPEVRFPSGEALAEAIGQLRGRELRAPPLVRSFLRNAEVTTAVFLTVALVQQPAGNVEGFLNFILLALAVQLVAVARRLLREGYAFEDIRTALLAEAEALQDEADAAGSGKWMRRINGMWNRIWAGRFGRTFFRLAGAGLPKARRVALPSADRTELVLSRAVVGVYEELPSAVRKRVGDVPRVVQRLEREAEALRARGQTGERLTLTVGALENVRLALLRLQAGIGTVEDLTGYLSQARDIGERIDAELAARQEVRELLGE